MDEAVGGGAGNYTNNPITTSATNPVSTFWQEGGTFNTGPFAIGDGVSASGAPTGLNISNATLLIAGGLAAGFFLLWGLK